MGATTVLGHRGRITNEKVGNSRLSMRWEGFTVYLKNRKGFKKRPGRAHAATQRCPQTHPRGTRDRPAGGLRLCTHAPGPEHPAPAGQQPRADPVRAVPAGHCRRGGPGSRLLPQLPVLSATLSAGSGTSYLSANDCIHGDKD
jgi:hypothetical protein